MLMCTGGPGPAWLSKGVQLLQMSCKVGTDESDGAGTWRRLQTTAKPRYAASTKALGPEHSAAELGQQSRLV